MASLLSGAFHHLVTLAMAQLGVWQLGDPAAREVAAWKGFQHQALANLFP